MHVIRAQAARWSSHGAWAGLRSIGRTPLRAVLLGAVVFALPTTVALFEKHEGEQGIEAQVHVQALITELRIQDGLQGRLIGGQLRTQDVRRELATSRVRAREHLSDAVSLCLSADGADQIVGVTQRYSESVDEEVRLLSSGQEQAAAELDETQVDPAFDRVLTILENQARQLESQAKKTQWLSDVWMLVAVLSSLILVGVVQSRRRRSEVRNQAKQQSEAHYRTLIDQSSDLVLVVDRAGRATFVSPSVERLLTSHHQDPRTDAHIPADTDPLDFVAAVDPLDRERFVATLQAAAPGSMSGGKFRLTGRHSTSTFEMTVQDLTADPSVRGLVMTAHDVTEHLALQQEMEHRALHDELTGLPNRALLADRFAHALIGAERAGTSVGLLLLDLDRFKEVNDTFGHHYGDELLRQIGPRLTSVLRGVDTFARLGGDEFAVLLQDVHVVGDAVEVATTLLAALSLPFHVEDVDLNVEASIGVVISGEHGQDPITLMQHADIAMYIAKGQHLGVFVYDPSMDKHSGTKPAIGRNLSGGRRTTGVGALRGKVR